ncbi:MAG TPA: exosortase-associated EpsI family protein [Gemmataceae bacterium]|jgi:hypothetical protein|nr:exosortase-associated EpsI family protein [Gemmataceae bacterium]
MIPAACGVVVLLASGWVHGLWTNRWGASEELRQAVARLDRVPRTFGDWRGTDHALDPEAIRLSGLAGYVWRDYKNRLDGRRVSVLLVCGRGGHVTVHTPDICFEGLGYEKAGDQVRYNPPAAHGVAPAQFWAMRFSKPGRGAGEFLRVLWAFRGAQSWEAPANPRVDFAHLPALYKLYVVRPLDSGGEALDGGPVADFMQELLPELDKALARGA